MSKRTWQPSKLKRVRSQGFRQRLLEAIGVLKSRRAKKRDVLCPAAKNKRYK